MMDWRVFISIFIVYLHCSVSTYLLTLLYVCTQYYILNYWLLSSAILLLSMQGYKVSMLDNNLPLVDFLYAFR